MKATLQPVSHKCKTIGARGGVCFEAGCAHALDIPVIHTVRQDRKDIVPFDVNHLNRMEWKDGPDWRKPLPELIVAVLGPGRGHASDERMED